MLTRGPRINKLPQNAVLELFDLSTDPEEKQNIASQNMYVWIYFLRTNGVLLKFQPIFLDFNC